MWVAIGQRLLGRRPRQAELEYWHTQEPISYFPGPSRPQTHTPPFPFSWLLSMPASLLSKAQLWPQPSFPPPLHSVLRSTAFRIPFSFIWSLQHHPYCSSEPFTTPHGLHCVLPRNLPASVFLLHVAIQVFLSIILQFLLPTVYGQERQP